MQNTSIRSAAGIQEPYFPHPNVYRQLLQRDNESFAEACKKRDFREGATAYLGKRKPIFNNR